MKYIRENLGKRWIPYTIATCSAVLLYLFFTHIGSLWGIIRGIFRFVSPIFWGVIIAYVVDALVVFYHRSLFRRIKRTKLARRLAVILAIVTILLLLTLFFVALIPPLIDSISGLISNLGGYASSLRTMLDSANLEIGGFSLDLTAITAYGDSLLQNLVTVLQDNIGRIINTSFHIGKGFVNLSIECILAIYFLLDKEKIMSVAKRLLQRRLTGERYAQVSDFLHRCSNILIRFITFDLIDAVIVGVVNFLFMTITGMPYAILISVVVAVANLVPTFGPIVGGVVGALILLLVNPWLVLWFLIFTFILQTIDGYILKPKLYGDTLGISPLWILVCIIVGGRMFGTAGVLLAIPFAAISDYAFRSDFWKQWGREEKAGDGPRAAAAEQTAAAEAAGPAYGGPLERKAEKP